MLRLIVIYSLAFYALISRTATGPCPVSWEFIGDSCYMNQTVLHNHSDGNRLCDTHLEGSKLAVLETDSETEIVFKMLGLMNETRHAIGPFPPCGNDTCYFVTRRASGPYQVGSVSCDSTLPFICEGEPFYEEPKQVERVTLPSTTPGSVTIIWERPDNVSGYRVALEKSLGGGEADPRHVDAEDPSEVTFDGLDGGTEYRAAIYSVNGPKESEPRIVDFCTIPSEVSCVQHTIQGELLVLEWPPSSGRVHQYRIEITAPHKEGWTFDPVYTKRLYEEFEKVDTEKMSYNVTAEAVVRFNGKELRSATYVHSVVRDPSLKASVEVFSESCENVKDSVRKPSSPVPIDAEDVTVSNIGTDTLTVNWTSRSNVSSFHVTAFDFKGYSPNSRKSFAAHEPKVAVFDSLQGGTEYTVAVFTYNGSMESDPVTLTVATIPMQIPVIYVKAKDKELKLFWDEAPGYADDYFFRLVDAVDKNYDYVVPIYAGDKNEVTFKELEKRTEYKIEAYTVVWFKNEELLSAPRKLAVTTPISGEEYVDSLSVTRRPTLSPTTEAMTTAVQVLFCPQINYEPTTTQVPPTTVATTTDLTTQPTTTQQPTTLPQTTQETTQLITTQAESTTTKVPPTTVLTTQTTTTTTITTQQPTTTPQTSQEPTTLQQTTMKTTTRNTTPQETTIPAVTPSACESIFHEPHINTGINTSMLFAQQTFDFVNRSLNFFFNQFGEGNLHRSIINPGDIADTWECVYRTNFSTEQQVKLVPDLLEALLRGFLTGAKWAPTIQVKGHPFAGGTDVEIWRSDNSSSEGCGSFSKVDVEPSWLTFDVPNSAIEDNGTGCRSLLVMKMEKVDDLLPENGCSDDGEFQCDELETPFPLVTVAMDPAKPPPFTEPVTVGFQWQNEVPGFIPVCVWLETKPQASSDGLRQYSWNSSGCDTLEEKGAIKCRCYHLTSFSVIMRVADYKIDEGHERALHVIGMLGCITTIVCACLTIAIYVYLRILKEERIIHTQFLSSIALSQLIFLIGIDLIKYEVLCTVVSIALFYFFSATFTWMLVETGHLYLSVVKVFSSGSTFKLYFFVGWGLPVISVLITSAVGLSRDEFISKDYCWLSTRSNLIWGFTGPALVIVMVNTVMLVAVLREISSLIERDITKMKANKYRTTAKAMMVFMPMVGLPWIFGFFALNSSLIIFDYIFTTLNSFQGLSLFMILIVGNKEVRNRIRGRIDDLNRATGEKTMDCNKRTSVVPSAMSTTGTSISTELQKESRPDEDKRSWATPQPRQRSDDEGEVIVTSMENAWEEDLSAI